jgi:predicted amidohydrolase YtcJ
VILSHASGHSLFANEAAMNVAGVTAETPDPVGGRIVRDSGGKAIGVFEENAMDIIEKAYAEYQSHLSSEARKAEWYSAIEKAQAYCLQHGVTSFEDAGSTFVEIDRYRQMAIHDSLDIRLWVMIKEPFDSLIAGLDGFPILRAGQDRFTCRAIKT